MNKFLAGLSFLTSGYFIVFLIVNFIKPSPDTSYSKALLVNLIITPVLVFLFMLWPTIVSSLKNKTGLGFSITMALLIAILGSSLIIGTFGIKTGLWFLAFYAPIVLRHSMPNEETSAMEVIKPFLFYFGAFFLAAIIFALLNALSVDLSAQQNHFDKIWPNYHQGITMMLSIYLFGIFNQVTEIRKSLKTFSAPKPILKNSF